MENILELIRERRSVRSFDGSELSAAEKRALRSFSDSIENPWGRWVEFRLLDREEHVLSSPVIRGETAYLGAKTAKAPHAEEALGYSFEMLMLYALSMGLGTVWLGGTLDRRAFERAMDLESDELMPCVSPVGRPAAKMSLRETVMRRGTTATTRQSFSELFFDEDFRRPLSEETAGELSEPLKAVPRAPSAVNRQPSSGAPFPGASSPRAICKRSTSASRCATLPSPRMPWGFRCAFLFPTRGSSFPRAMSISQAIVSNKRHHKSRRPFSACGFSSSRRSFGPCPAQGLRAARTPRAACRKKA